MWKIIISWILFNIIKSFHCQVPVLKNHEPVITLNSGDNLQIECPIGIPGEGQDLNYNSNVMYEWTIKELTQVSIEMNLKYSFLQNNRILKLNKPVTYEDSGEYTCKGVTGFGSKIAVFKIKIIDPSQDRLCAVKTSKDPKLEPPCFLDPQMKSEQIVIRKEVGSNVTLSCDAIGTNPIKYLWFSGKTIANWIQTAQDVRSSTFKITNLKVDYSGQYTCHVSNAAGLLQYTYQLIVTESLKNLPKILTELSNYTFQIKENASVAVEIECECESPIIKWFKKVDSFDSSKIQSNGIHLPHAKDNEKGEYYTTLEKEVSTKKIQPNVFKILLNIDSIDTQHNGKYVLMVANKILKHFEYRVIYITVEPDKDALGIKNNLIVYIAVPMVILISSLAVIIYCCFRRHTSGYARSNSASRSSHRCANGSALPSLTNGSNTGSEKLKSPSTTSTGLVVGYNPYKFVYPSQAPSSNYDQYSVLSVSHSSQTPPQYFQPQNAVSGAQFNNSNPYHHNNGYVAVPISHYQA